MLLNTRLLGSFSEAVVAGAAVREPPPGIHVQEPLLIGSTTALGGHETLRASLAVSIIMPTALSFLDAD